MDELTRTPKKMRTTKMKGLHKSFVVVGVEASDPAASSFSVWFVVQKAVGGEDIIYTYV